MSEAESQASAAKEAVRWWHEGEWEPIPPGMLSAETSRVSIAISEAEYPALSALLRYADNVDDYLHMLGVSHDSIFGQDDSSTAPNGDDEPMGMGE